MATVKNMLFTKSGSRGHLAHGPRALQTPVLTSVAKSSQSGLSLNIGSLKSVSMTELSKPQL